MSKSCRITVFFVATLAGFAAAATPAAAGEDTAPVGADDALFIKMPLVEAATLHAQTLEEAPASVTVITAAEIRRYGYRTLKEALQSVRGFYFSNDRMYDYSGIRGLAIPGDYNTRFLVMLNGHPLTDTIYNSNNYFGQDFGLDMDLVERIEIVRGPNSALYGSNGMLANINVVTKSPVDLPEFRASIEESSFGANKVTLASSLDLGRGANLLLSASVFRGAGRDLQFPDGLGVAHGVDAQKGYHSFANLTWGRWSFTGYFNARESRVPVGYGSLFDSQGNRVLDSRNLIGAGYTRDVGKSGNLRWQVFYDQYRYSDRWDYAEEAGVEDNRTENWGDWATTQLTYSRTLPRIGTLTAGGQATVEMRNLQINRNAAPVPSELLRIDAPDRSAAVFAQQEWALTARWKLYFGLRFDASRHFGGFVSPRLALVYQPSKRASYKLVYGHPFRNPSAFERYYDDNGLSYRDNPNLTRETAHAFEASAERKLTADLSALVNVFDYHLKNVIQSAWISDTVSEYENGEGRRSRGVEFELRGKPLRRLEGLASFVYQEATRAGSGLQLSNSPRSIAQARAAVPLGRNRVYLSSGLRHLSSRTTSAGVRLRPVALVDVTVSTVRLFREYDLVCGIRNALNWQYDHPVDFTVDRIRADGRSFFLKLIWESREQ